MREYSFFSLAQTEQEMHNFSRIHSVKMNSFFNTEAQVTFVLISTSCQEIIFLCLHQIVMGSDRCLWIWLFGRGFFPVGGRSIHLSTWGHQRSHPLFMGRWASEGQFRSVSILQNFGSGASAFLRWIADGSPTYVHHQTFLFARNGRLVCMCLRLWWIRRVRQVPETWGSCTPLQSPLHRQIQCVLMWCY